MIMSKESYKKATFEDLLAKKMQKERSKHQQKDILIPGINKTLTFVKPSEKELLRMIDEMEAIGADGASADQIECYRHIIYDTCPDLQNTELHKKLEVVDPYDVPKVLFDFQDIQEIIKKLFPMLGFGNIEENIKN